MNNEIREQNLKYYDTEASVYDSVRYSSAAGRRVEKFHQLVLERLLSECLLPGADILELGCGTGRLLESFLGREFSLNGIDISPGMLAKAKERFVDSESAPSLLLSPADNTPFHGEKFDAIYSILVLNLIPNYRDAINEMARLLKPGGTLVFNLPNLQSVYFIGGLYVNFRQQTVGSNQAGGRYSHWFSKKEWKGALEDAGLRVVEVLGQPPLVRLRDDVRPLNATKLGSVLSKSIYIKAIKIDEHAAS